MDNKLFEEMLQEIDAMTADEYWSLYREAAKLTDFPLEDASFIQVQFTNTPTPSFSRNFDNSFDKEAIAINYNYSQETLMDGDDIWPKAA